MPLRCLSHGAVFIRRPVDIFFEGAGEMALRRKAEIQGDLRRRLVGVTQEAFSLFDFEF